MLDIPEITKADAGGARTFLILGSDARYADKKAGLKPRSDTILLVRADPNKSAIAVMSIPRDLAVEIPGYGQDKINAAYEQGGPRLTVRTVKKLFEDATGKEFPINNVINVNFGTFKRAVNYVGGVYVDVDRDYFNDNSGGGERYAAIDINPGYQKLTGQDALDYVRYRHTDNDFIRAARQQDFLRQARAQSGVRKLADISKRKKLARAFGRYFEVDRSFKSSKELLSMLKLGIYLIQESPTVNEVRFRRRRVRQPDRGHAAVRLSGGPGEDRARVHEREVLGQADADGEADQGREGVRAPAQEAQPQQARLGRRAWRSRAPRAWTRPCSPTRSSTSRSTSRRCAPRAPPTRAPSRASTRSATSSASGTRPTGWCSPRAWRASTTASRA